MDDGVSPALAWHYAQQWRALAATQGGTQREQSLAAALAWEREYYRLTAADHAWPPRVQATPSRATVPSLRRRHRGAIAMVAAVLAVVLVACGAIMFSPGAPSRGAPDAQVPPASLGSLLPDTDNGAARGTSLHGPQSEEAWLAGTSWVSVPAHVAEEPTTPFSDQYPDVNDWLRSQDPSQKVHAIFTSDPAYNCGIEKGDTSDDYVFAGCEDPQYGPVIFVYWGKHTTLAEREFVVAHELSHYYQWYYYYDLNASATQEGFDANDQWLRDVEADASCRVLSWGGYSTAVANESSAPCDIDGWYEGWLVSAGHDVGITVTNY